jgi:hypothetical protein
MINDLPEPVKLEIKTVLLNTGVVGWSSTDSVSILPLGKASFNLQIILPEITGSYQLRSSFVHATDSIFSLYEFEIEPGE